MGLSPDLTRNIRRAAAHAVDADLSINDNSPHLFHPCGGVFGGAIPYLYTHHETLPSLHEYVLVLIQGQAMLDEHFAICRAIQAYVTR